LTLTKSSRLPTFVKPDRDEIRANALGHMAINPTS
jgi:hypothetical protein